MEQRAVCALIRDLHARELLLLEDSLLSVQVAAGSSRKDSSSLYHRSSSTLPSLNWPRFCRRASQQTGGARDPGHLIGRGGEKPVFYINPGETTEEDNEDSLSYPLIGINQAHFVGLFTSQHSSHGLAPQIYFEWHIGWDASGEDPGFVDMAKEQVDVARLGTLSHLLPDMSHSAATSPTMGVCGP